jgi:hypothetical protein
LIETNGLLFGSIGTSTMIAVDVLESDFATAEKGEKDGNRATIDKRANTACTRLVGVCAFSGSLRGLELTPLKWRFLVPPTSG